MPGFDIDLLSNEVKIAILNEAAGYHADLSRHFSLLSLDCKDEPDFILSSRELVDELKAYDAVELSNEFYEMPINKKRLNKTLDQIIANLDKLANIE